MNALGSFVASLVTAWNNSAISKKKPSPQEHKPVAKEVPQSPHPASSLSTISSLSSSSSTNLSPASSFVPDQECKSKSPSKEKVASIPVSRSYLQKEHLREAKRQIYDAICKDNTEKLLKALDYGHRPNLNQLLAFLVMCRFPTHAHQLFIEDKTGLNLQKHTMHIAYKYSHVLLAYGVQLTEEEVNEFLDFQQQLEEEFDLPQSPEFTLLSRPDLRDPGKHIFEKVGQRQRFKQTTNPYIKIILKEIQDGVYFSDHERVICKFAAEILPKLLQAKLLPRRKLSEVVPDLKETAELIQSLKYP